MNTKALHGLPKINALFETVSDGIVGRTSVPIKRVELEDDGSYSVVIDYLPTPLTRVMIPTETMEQEFTTQRRLGVAQGLDEAMRLVIHELGEHDPLCKWIVSRLLQRKKGLTK